MDPNGDVKDILSVWLRKQRDMHTERQSQAVLSYTRACLSVGSHQGPICDPKTMKSLRHIGDKMVSSFQKHLAAVCKEKGWALPDAWNPEAQTHQRLEKRRGADTDAPVKKRKKAQYIPRKRSGGYAILLALYLKDRNRSGLKKSEIVEFAAPFCDSSFANNPGSNEFYSAWNSIKSLEKHELVSYTGRRTLWYITDEGIAVAEKLREIEGVARSSPSAQRTAFNTSYDNGMFVTPDNSMAVLDNSDIENVSDPRDLLPPHLLSSPVHTRESPKLFVPSSEPDFKVQPIIRSPEKKAEPKAALIEPKDTKNSTPSSDTTKSSLGAIVHDTKKRILNNTKYSIWPNEHYEILVIIDEREIKSKSDRDYFENRLTSLGVSCEVRVLSVGDVVWVARNKHTKEEAVLNTICERKRLDDLASSIRDGRFVEQKQRLSRASMKGYYYLVEETGIDATANFAQSLQTAQSMVMLLAKFQLRRFRNTDDTTLFLASLTKVIIDQFKQQDTKLIVMKPRSIETQQEYSEMMETFRAEFENRPRRSSYECCHTYSNFKDILDKSQMFTVKEMFLTMLLAVRGITIEKALAIQSRFPTPRSLLTYFHTVIHDKPDSTKQKALADACPTAIGSKKITNALSQKLYEIWGV